MVFWPFSEHKKAPEIAGCAKSLKVLYMTFFACDRVTLYFALGQSKKFCPVYYATLLNFV
jgi:hypothetical protein